MSFAELKKTGLIILAVTMLSLFAKANAAHAFAPPQKPSVANSVKNCARLGNSMRVRGCLLMLAARLAYTGGRDFAVEVIKHSLIAAGLEGLAQKWVMWASAEPDVAHRASDKQPPGCPTP